MNWTSAVDTIGYFDTDALLDAVKEAKRKVRPEFDCVVCTDEMFSRIKAAVDPVAYVGEPNLCNMEIFARPTIAECVELVERLRSHRRPMLVSDEPDVVVGGVA